MMDCPSRFPLSGLYVITDCTLGKAVLLEKTERILKKGVAVLQYRNKDRQSNNYLSIAYALKKRCAHYQCPLIINDDLALAQELDADGVHLGKDDPDVQVARVSLGPDKIIGASCYQQLDRAIYAAQNGANYIALGACYPSANKPNATKITRTQLQRIRSKIALPIVAIGGLMPENSQTIIDAGADLLAVISSLYRSCELEKTIDQFDHHFITRPAQTG